MQHRKHKTRWKVAELPQFDPMEEVIATVERRLAGKRC
jgi:hypothetical protein